jgi:hypothetical protein
LRLFQKKFSREATPYLHPLGEPWFECKTNAFSLVLFKCFDIMSAKRRNKLLLRDKYEYEMQREIRDNTLKSLKQTKISDFFN